MYLKFRLSKVSTFVLILFLCSAWVAMLNIGIVNAESNSLITVRHFSIQEILEGTHRDSLVGSFNASKGHLIKINLSSYSTNNGPFNTYVRICSDNHGVIFGAGGPDFSQTMFLDFEDTYNITIYKSPTFSCVQFVGSIDVLRKESSENWVEVTRFTENNRLLQNTFTIEHVEWRIRWEYESITEIPEEQPALYVYLWDQKFPSKYVETLLRNGTKETSGTFYIHNRTGTFSLGVLRTVPRFTLIIEQNLTSIPEFPQCLILPTFFGAILLGVILGKKITK